MRTSWVEQLVGVEDVARPDADRLDRRGVRAEALQQRADAGDDDARAPGRACAAATGPRRRRPIVSTLGLTRSNGSVSHGGEQLDLAARA